MFAYYQEISKDDILTPKNGMEFQDVQNLGEDVPGAVTVLAKLLPWPTPRFMAVFDMVCNLQFPGVSRRASCHSHEKQCASGSTPTCSAGTRSPSDSSQMVLSLPTVFSKLMFLVACGATPRPHPSPVGSGAVSHL